MADKNEQIGADIVVDASGVKKGVNDAVNDIGKIEKALDDVADEASKSGGEVEESTRKMSSAFSGIGETIGELKPVIAGAFAGAGALATSLASDFTNSQTKIQNSFGLTSSEAKKMNGIVQEVWSEGFGESVDEVAESIVVVKRNMQQIDGKELQQATKYAITFSDTFGGDINENVRGASALMTAYGISSEKAFDLMTVGAQHGLNKTDELGDNLAEYATLFEENGYSAEQMFSILEAGLEGGAYNLDKVNDLVKEFGVRMADGSVEKAVTELGGSFEKTFKKLKKSGADNQEIFQALGKEVSKLKTEQEKAAAISAIWGSMGEDAGTKVIDSMTGVEDSYTDVDNAAKKMVKTAQDDPFTRMKVAAREFGEALLPVAEIGLDLADDILPLISAGTKALSNGWKSLTPEMQKAVGIMLSLTAAGAGGKIALGGLTSVLGGLLNPMSLFSKDGKTATKVATGLAGETTKATGTFEKLGSKVMGSSAAFGPWGLAIAAGSVAVVGLGVALTKAGQDANESRDRVYKWGSDIGESADKALTKYENFSDGASTAMTSFGDNVSENSDSVKADFEKITESVNGMMKSIDEAGKGAKDSIKENLSQLPEWMQKNLKEATDAQAKEVDRTVDLAQKAADQTLSIYKKHAKDNTKLTKAENDLILNNQKIMNNQQVELMELNSKEKKSVIAALNGELEGMSEEQLRNNIDNIALAMDKEQKLYKKQKDVLKDMYKSGQIDKSDYDAQLKLLTDSHTNMTDTIEANMLRARRASGVSEDKIRIDMERLGFDYEKAAKVIDEQTKNAADSNGILAQSTKNMSNDVVDANQRWNALVFDPKTGDIKTNAKEEIQKASESKAGWDNLKFVAKNANLSSNAKSMMATALIENGKWEELSFDEKKLIITYDGSAEVIKAMEDMGTWNDLDAKQKSLIANANTSLALEKVLTDMGVWNTLPVDVKKMIGDNTDIVKKIQSSEGMIVEYDGKKIELKKLLGDNTDVVNKIKAGKSVIVNYNGQKIDLKQLYANNKDLVTKITSGKNVIKDYNKTDPEKKTATVKTNQSEFTGSLNAMLGQWSGAQFGTKTANIAVNAVKGATAKNANGTPSFAGGLTTLHERGEEIYDLPQGTRVIPHSLSSAMMERAGRDYAKNVSNMNNSSFKQSINIANFNNNSRQDISSLMEDMSKEAKKKNAWRSAGQ
ncbi:hypothetical protein HB992_09750 [Listeria seeligeri]|uniref:phage tail tape measure protein n=1 Tax=Listeria seeligeri TaxID=1640 RepID=UPI0016256F18|nr:phage tail tape measure protein [Listeria seeligeri]MBC1734952.1 hypothetical protein [Listeria seeligeri]